MTTAKVLIIDCSGDCSLFAAKVLMPEGVGVLAASGWESAREMMAASRPDLILADSSVVEDPLVWVEEVHRLNLAAQVIVVADQPDFQAAMDWVAGGIFNVMTRPLDGDRLRRLARTALENCRAFSGLLEASEAARSAEANERSMALAEFYRGLTGRLDGLELKRYIADSVKRLTGAGLVEFCLVDNLSGSAYCLETYSATSADEPRDKAGRLIQAPLAGSPGDNYRLGFELSAAGEHLGEIYLHFDRQEDMLIQQRSTLLEIVAAVSEALGSVLKYQKAINLAARDGLTGLYNRRIFNEVLQREFAKARRHNFNLSLLSLDLDHFKSVNDNYGHQTGDLVLKTVADIIRAISRATDLPARIGGEEFVILLPHTNQDQATVVAERLKKMLADQLFEAAGGAFRQTVSQGLAGLEHFMVNSAEDMVYWADQALYLAKREGRDTVRSVSDLPMTPVMKDGAYAFQ